MASQHETTSSDIMCSRLPKLHVSPGLTEFPDVAFDSLASNSGYSDSNLYRRNDDVFRGFVCFIRTNLVIKDTLARAVLRLRTQEGGVHGPVTVWGRTVSRNTVIAYMLLLTHALVKFRQAYRTTRYKISFRLDPTRLVYRTCAVRCSERWRRTRFFA